MVPAFPRAQEQFPFYPIQLGLKSPEGSCKAFSPDHPLPNLSCSPPGWVPFSSQTTAVLESVLFTVRTRPDGPTFTREDTAPQSFLSAGFSLTSYASPHLSEA